MTRVLLAVDSPVFQGTLLDELCMRHGASLSNITVVTSQEELAKHRLGGEPYDAVVSASASGNAHSVQTLGQLLALAKAGASVTVQEPVASSPAEDVSSLVKLQQLALFGGLSQGATSTPYTIPLSPTLSGREGVQSAAVEGRKLAWEAGAQQAIKRKLGGKQSSAVPAVAAKVAPAVSIWASINTDDAELLDDEELLTEEDRVRPEAPVANGCAPSRSACKDCTCGRAEAEAAGAPAQKLTKEMLENPGAAGGCGSCSLGDAFRCGSCPYRGLPSFQPGKKIELPVGFLAEDL